MRRRQLLHTVGAIGLSGLAGCSIPGRTRELRSPRRTDESDGAYWTFTTGDERLLIAGIEFGVPPASDLIPLQFNTWHREGTHLERLRIELRFGRPVSGVPPDVYLDTFDTSPDPRFDFHDDPDSGTTTLDVPDLGPVGVGSLSLNFLVQPHGWLPEEIGVAIREVVSEDGPLTARSVAEVDDRIEFDVGER